MTLHSFEVELRDAARGLRGELRLRVARHPSETVEHLLTRVLAWCHAWEDGIEMQPRGICAGNEPALRVAGAGGRTRVWIEVGTPSAARLARAWRSADEVRIYCHRDVGTARRRADALRRRRDLALRVFTVDARALEELEAVLERRNRWRVVRRADGLELTVAGTRFDFDLVGAGAQG